MNLGRSVLRLGRWGYRYAHTLFAQCSMSAIQYPTMNVWERLVGRLRAAGVRPDQLAKAAGISEEAAATMLEGTYEPNLSQLDGIAKLLNMPVAALFEGSEDVDANSKTSDSVRTESMRSAPGTVALESEYAAALRKSMAGENRLRRRVTIRELAAAVGRHYEHVRKLLSGQPVASQDLNEKICRYLGLEPRALWRMAEREKLMRRFGPEAVDESLELRSLAELWQRLSLRDRREVLRIVEQRVFGEPPSTDAY